MDAAKYEEMYLQTYGISACEGNSYLHCDEDSKLKTSNAEFNKYKDFSGAIKFMDDEYLNNYPYDIEDIGDDDSEYEFAYGFDEDGDPHRYDTNQVVHGYPLTYKEVRDGYLSPSLREDDLVEFSYEGKRETATKRELSKCPCFLMSNSLCTKDKTVCDGCAWCEVFPAYNPFRMFQFLGSTFRLGDGVNGSGDYLVEGCGDKRAGRYAHLANYGILGSDSRKIALGKAEIKMHGKSILEKSGGKRNSYYPIFVYIGKKVDDPWSHILSEGGRQAVLVEHFKTQNYQHEPSRYVLSS
jgi:hypothetical protein